MSHKDEDVVTAFAVAMGKEFSNGTMIKRGKVFDYLGMEIDFESCPGTMIISMIKYLQKIIAEFPELSEKTTACPGQGHLFTVRDEKIGSSSTRKWLSSSTEPQRNSYFCANEQGLM